MSSFRIYIHLTLLKAARSYCSHKIDFPRNLQAQPLQPLPSITMATIISKIRAAAGQKPSKNTTRRTPQIVKPNYDSKEVAIPPTFLAPFADASQITVERIDFGNSPLPAYKKYYAVVLDNVLSREECEELIKLAEMSTGAHQEEAEGSINEPFELVSKPDTEADKTSADTSNGWRPALVNIGGGREMLSPEYRNSDRIIWDQKEIVSRLWQRVLQGEGMREDLTVLDGEKFASVLGNQRKEKWISTEGGLNERMRFLKYGPGQFFRSKSMRQEVGAL